MVSRKIGESQVIETFSRALQGAMDSKYGQRSTYAFGNFSGKQDRVFADVFVATKTRSILIEFKEYESEISAELLKPLRGALCRNLTSESAALARRAHLIAYSNADVDPNISISVKSYVDTVCAKFGVGSPPLVPAGTMEHSDFIDAFLADQEGVTYDEFIKYVKLMSDTAGGSGEGNKLSFRSVLFSKSQMGSVVARKFMNLEELAQLLQINPSRPIVKQKPNGGPIPKL